jgi:polyribonucleotide nucleotidyltransferase
LIGVASPKSKYVLFYDWGGIISPTILFAKLDSHLRLYIQGEKMGTLNNPQKVETEIGGRKLIIETGRFAKQAHGAVYIQYGDTTALVTAVSDHKAAVGLDFFPLTIEFQEKFYSSGKIPGGFFKKEGRPTDWATLMARMTDRPLRPLFPEGYKYPTQVAITLLSYDGQNEPEAITGLGASAALYISDIPYETPIATVRVARVDGKLVINPLLADLDKADINVLVAGSRESIIMVEGGANGALEADFLEALYFGHNEIQKLVDLQEELRKLVGKPKREWTKPAEIPADVSALVREAGQAGLEAAFSNVEKVARYKALGEVEAAVTEKAQASWSSLDATALAEKLAFTKQAFGKLKKEVARSKTLKTQARLDGRAYTDIRPIEVEVGVLPRVHGSALFTRGETQALAIVTLGTREDEQMIDSARGKFMKRLMLHYNFPPYSVGETGRFGGNSRREIGHGALAERAVSAVFPTDDKFPYVVRVVAEILACNGSSSMATVCSSSMALMDAGVPVKDAVAGIAMGLMEQDGQTVVLSDILGDEDHLGDMDLKVCGTESGVTAVQMDIKLRGVSREVMQKALLQARDGRLHILNEMKKAISTVRSQVSEFAPRFVTLQISQDRIKDLIGPGGKNIKGIVAATGVKMDIEDSGKVNIASNDPAATERAVQMVKDLTEEAEIGKIYMGTVVRIADFGCFVEIMPGTDGLVHISELAPQRVAKVTDVVQEGDQIPVKVLEIDRSGKIRLSRKAALPSNEQQPTN